MLIRTTFRTAPNPSARAHGDDPAWARWLPTMWHALADPEGTWLWPERPAPTLPGAEDGMAALGWWLPAVQLLAYSLAWPRLDVGLRWWYDAGQPTTDPRLELLAAMLGEDVDELAGWAWRSNHTTELCATIAAATGTRLPDISPVRVDDAWLGRLEERVRDQWSPYGQESDPMHLSGHAAAPVYELDQQPDVLPVLLHGSAQSRKCSLVVDQYAGWYSTLARLGGDLPPLHGDHSWRVDVVCRPVGYLGTYRRSRLTGRWFSGRHRYHEVGYQDPPS